LEGDLIRINHWLKPLSWVYGWGVWLRNLCFDAGVLKSHRFALPVISVGNITVGGTGKTPHVEYLVRLLKDVVPIAVLSRGYKRKSSGFILANSQSTVEDIGDEPFQMKQKFPGIEVAVCSDRVKGIERLTGAKPDSEEKPDKSAAAANVGVVLLDDAFQHRYVKPGVNILLVDYHRLIIYDKLLPAGRLREPLSGKMRADIVIVTKCPQTLNPMEYRVLIKAMNLYPFQQLYFTTMDYDDPLPLVKRKKNSSAHRPDSIAALKKYNVLLVTGIASPEQMLQDLERMTASVTPLSFSDHHDFRQTDIETITEAFRRVPEPRCIVTTEKDATRLQPFADSFTQIVREAVCVLPIKVKFLLNQEKVFNENILDYVRKNSADGILAPPTNDYEPEDSNSAGNRPRTISF